MVQYKGQIDETEQILRVEWVEITSPCEKTSNRSLVTWAGVTDWTALSSPKG